MSARFRKHKSWLVARFITKEVAPRKGSPNADKKPWELYNGYFIEEQWKEFKLYCQSDEFKVCNNIIKMPSYAY